ncbi:hypothetical protein Tco_0027861 [Tanacetum coccineum]
MVNCNHSRTPVNTESKLGIDGDSVSDPTLYQSLTDLVAYLDADWAGFPTTRCSTSEAEYHGVANVVAETCCCAIYYASCILLYLSLRLSIAIMLVLFIYLQSSSASAYVAY